MLLKTVTSKRAARLDPYSCFTSGRIASSILIHLNMLPTKIIFDLSNLAKRLGIFRIVLIVLQSICEKFDVNIFLFNNLATAANKGVKLL